MDLVNQGFKLIITDIQVVFQKNGSYTRKVEEIRSRSNVFFRSLSYNYTEFFGCDKLICTSGEGSRIKNNISKQVSHKTYINKIFFHQNWVLVVPPMVFPPIRTLVEYFQKILLHKYFKHILQKSVIVLSYI